MSGIAGSPLVSEIRPGQAKGRFCADRVLSGQSRQHRREIAYLQARDRQYGHHHRGPEAKVAHDRKGGSIPKMRRVRGQQRDEQADHSSEQVTLTILDLWRTVGSSSLKKSNAVPLADPQDRM